MGVAFYDSPIGVIRLESEGSVLVGLRFVDEADTPATHDDTDPAIAQGIAWLDDYFAGRAPSTSRISFRLPGTSFQRSVWHRLLRIPLGKTVSYGQLASEYEQMTGKKMAAQAIGHAVGCNPVAIIVPCHRVLGADGSLHGYAYGIDKKRWLLAHEGVEI